MTKGSPTPYFAGIAAILFTIYALNVYQDGMSDRYKADRYEPIPIEEKDRLRTSARAERLALELHDDTADRQIKIESLRLIGEGAAPAVAESEAAALVERRRTSILYDLDFLERAVD